MTKCTLAVQTLKVLNQPANLCNTLLALLHIVNTHLLGIVTHCYTLLRIVTHCYEEGKKLNS